MITLQLKLQAMLWDVPENRRLEIADKILSNPVETLQDFWNFQ